MEAFFNDFHNQAKGVMYEVESAFVSFTQPKTVKQKRATTTVRQPFMLTTPTGCDTERWGGHEEHLIGVWHYGERSKYEIKVDDGKLMFREGKRKSELVASAEADWMIGKLLKANDEALGAIKIRYSDGTLISQYKSLKSNVWGMEVVATREPQGTSALTENSGQRSSKCGQQFLESEATGIDGMTARCHKSRAMSESHGEALRPRKHALTAPPQELHFVAPQDCVAGQPVCLLGPHGDPITVPLPEGAVAGRPCSVYLGPKSSFQVVVPEGALPGTSVMFYAGEDNDLLNTIVPPGKMPGDTMEIIPPVVLIQVPRGCKGGDEVVYTTPQGTPALVQIPEGYSGGHYFATLLPLPPNMASFAMKDHAAPKEPKEDKTAKQEPPQQEPPEKDAPLPDISGLEFSTAVDEEDPPGMAYPAVASQVPEVDQSISCKSPCATLLKGDPPGMAYPAVASQVPDEDPPGVAYPSAVASSSGVPQVLEEDPPGVAYPPAVASRSSFSGASGGRPEPAPTPAPPSASPYPRSASASSSSSEDHAEKGILVKSVSQTPSQQPEDVLDDCEVDLDQAGVCKADKVEKPGASDDQGVPAPAVDVGSEISASVPVDDACEDEASPPVPVDVPCDDEVPAALEPRTSGSRLPSRISEQVVDVDEAGAQLAVESETQVETESI